MSLRTRSDLVVIPIEWPETVRNASRMPRVVSNRRSAGWYGSVPVPMAMGPLTPRCSSRSSSSLAFTFENTSDVKRSGSSIPRYLWV